MPECQKFNSLIKAGKRAFLKGNKKFNFCFWVCLGRFGHIWVLTKSIKYGNIPPNRAFIRVCYGILKAFEEMK
jgi:hypothetical protein